MSSQLLLKISSISWGDEVVITEGEFNGIHGRVTRIAGQQRVVVELFDGCLVATAYVPKAAIIMKNDTK